MPFLSPYPIRWDYFLPGVIRHQRLEAHSPSALRFLTVTLRISRAASRPFPASPASFVAILGFSPGLPSLLISKHRNSKFKLWRSQWPGMRLKYAMVQSCERGPEISASTRALALESSLGVMSETQRKKHMTPDTQIFIEKYWERKKASNKSRRGGTHLSFQLLGGRGKTIAKTKANLSCIPKPSVSKK